MTTVATLQVVATMQDNVSRQLNSFSDRIRFAGMRLRNAGIGLTIATAPLAFIFKSMVQDAMEYEAVSKGIAVVSKATGRDVTSVMAIINKHSGELMTKLDLTRGVLKLLSTSLSEVQIDQFIVMVKNGAAAMGEDMSSAFAMVSKGLKTYRMQNFDLIGVNLRMIEVYKKVRKNLSESSKAYIYAVDRSEDLTSEQKDAVIEQTILAESLRKTGVFSGIFAEYMRSTQGRVASFATATKDLSMSLGTFLLPEVVKLVENLKVLVDGVNNLKDDIKRNMMVTTGWVVLLLIITGVVAMLGGNFLWAAGQIALFFTGAKGLTLFAIPKIIAGFGALGVLIIGVGMAFGVVVKIISIFRDVAVDAFNVTMGALTKLSIKLSEAMLSIAEFTGDTKGVRFWRGELDKAHTTLAKIDKTSKDLKGIGKDFETWITYPWRTFGEQGRWRKDIEGWMSNLFKPSVEGEVGVGGEGEIQKPIFTPPMGGMPTGNLIIILPPVYGAQYGSQINLGTWSSLQERSGQDVIINAGTSNRYHD